MAFPHLTGVAVGPAAGLGERAVQLSMVLLQPVQRKLVAVLHMPAGCDAGVDVKVEMRVRAWEGGEKPTPEGLGAFCASAAPGPRRLTRIVALLNDALMAGVEQ